MSRRVIVVVAVLTVIAVAVIGYAYASPWLTVSKVKKAAHAGDIETVNAHVDFPALRESLKAWMNAHMAREFARPEMRENPFAALGLAIASKLTESIVDAMVTPEALRMMMEGQRPRPRAGTDAVPVGSAVPATQPAISDVETLMGYESRDRFVVTFRKKADPNETFALVWHRGGLTDWKLTAIRMPAPPSKPR